MINLPSLNWFCQRKDGRLVTNTYSGSFGTSPTLGIFNRPVFEYTVKVCVKDLEEDSFFRAVCAVNEYCKSGEKQLSPPCEKTLICVTEQNLITISRWLEDHYLEYKTKYTI